MIIQNEKINKALIEMGFEEYTTIQEEVIPLIYDGKDVIGHSQTGTGKTAAFAIPMLQKIDVSNETIQAIILCPTRELALQVKGEIDRIGKYIPKLKTIAIYGGESINKQIHALKHKPQIVIGTPGRTIDHINRKLVRLGHIKYVVLDEADEMLKMGFIEDIEFILSKTPTERQTVMFSATMAKPIVRLSKTYMNNPEVISVVTGEETNKDITQYYYQVHTKNKVEGVARLLHVYNPRLTLIFCNTKRKVDDITRDLTKKGYNVDKIHGDLQQAQRLHVLNKFHTGVLDILVATDVAARGLDIKNVEAVINYDVPEKAEFYVHRIGRTGRIGNKGYSFTLVSKKEQGLFQSILTFTKSSIKKRNIPTPEKVESVRKQKQIEEIEDVIQNINTNPMYDIADQLLENNSAEDVVKALLHKLQKKDSSEQINGDINESFTSKKHSHNSDEESVRYHLNMGRNQGVTPQSLASLISKKTKLHNSQINDISVAKSSSFFSTNKSKQMRVMKSLTNITFAGKKTSVRIANKSK
jgi:ATP-dependent RNA helicase DeaD